MEGLIGKKIGMTQIWDKDGVRVSVTVIEAGPCPVVQVKTAERDGYESVQLGWAPQKASRLSKAEVAHCAKAGLETPVRVLREFKADAGEAVKAGDVFNVSMFSDVGHVDVIGTGKGRGFQGVMKRHGFGGGVSTHGSMFHRLPGSIGASAFPSRVIAGTRSSGRMGGKQTTTKNLEVVKVDAENHLIYLRGAVPGARNTVVKIVKKPAKTQAA